MADPVPSLPLNIPDKPILSTAEVISLAEVAAKRTKKPTRQRNRGCTHSVGSRVVFTSAMRA